MHIEIWDTSRPLPYARNARVIPQIAIDKVASSIKEFGFRNPIIVDKEGVIIAGHTRLRAAQKLGLLKVPVHVASELTPAQVRAFRIADNRVATETSFDQEMLSLELLELNGLGFNLELTGFNVDELKELQAFAFGTQEGLTDIEEIPEAPIDPITQLDDVWTLGGHRIICGDSTKAEVVEKLLGNVKPHLMVTDPPYGVEYNADWRNKAMRSAVGGRAVGKVLNDDKADWREAWALFPGNIAYVWHAGLFSATVAESLEACGFKLRSQIIWAKSNFAIGRGDYHWHHEPCWYAVKGTGNWQGDRKQSTLWRIDKPQKSETGHSTQKPVECMRRPMENNSSPGQAIYEPFSGSGTSIMAAEQGGRSCYAIELNPAYVDVAVERWCGFTGKPAIRESDGAKWNDLFAAREAKKLKAA